MLLKKITGNLRGYEDFLAAFHNAWLRIWFITNVPTYYIENNIKIPNTTTHFNTNDNKNKARETTLQHEYKNPNSIIN